MTPLLHSNRQFWGFEPRIRLSFDAGSFHVKTLETPEELEAVFRLRHDIFHREHHGRVLASSMDLDEIDPACDHLGVFRAGKLVGTYRLNCSLFNSSFYAAQRFELSPLWALPGAKLELGRACVAADQRTGMAVHLLWKGISEYLRLTGVRYLFGCSSIRTLDPYEVAAIFHHLEDNDCLSPDLWLEVLPERVFPDWEEICDAHPRYPAITSLPPLIEAYLKTGAKIVAPPARDTYLACADFLTVLDAASMDHRFSRRYGPEGRLRSVPKSQSLEKNDEFL